MGRVGLHLRIIGTLNELIQKAVRLELPFFQCFFTDRRTSKFIVPDAQDMRSFLSRRWVYFNNLYLHASYFVNLAALDRTRHPLLVKELMMAKRLEFTHMIIHPGTVRRLEDKMAGIDAVVRMINYLLRRESDIEILLENTAHGNLAIGSNIEDFYALLAKLDQPDRVGFCIDTVHAHVAGYDIVSNQCYKQFIKLLEKTVGLERIKLIHLNETCELCGSRRDIHCCIGDKQAVLGARTLKRFLSDEQLVAIPMMLELPAVSEEDEQHILDKVNTWSKGYAAQKK